VGQGNECLYCDGLLCILEDNTICVLDTNTSTENCKIDISVSNNATAEASTSSDKPRISLLSFNDDIVTVHYDKKGRSGRSWILAFSTKVGPADNRLLTRITLESSYKLFARHTADCIYYGTHSGVNNDGHQEWEIMGKALSGKYNIPKCATLQLDKFFGTDIGSTVAFEIHKDHFYAVSNQTSFEVEEIDWTSFYHCIRFHLGNQILEANNKVYRRQHSEGPIHDSWTDISLQFDEATDRTMIVEARSEWQTNTRGQQRTFYISEFELQKKSLPVSEDGSPVTEASQVSLYPQGDALASLVDSSNKPNYAPEEERPSWKSHPESTAGYGRARSFILARTKFKGYNYSCNSFFDFVEDEHCCSESSITPCLRIRIGTRHEAPMDWEPPSQDGLSKVKPANTSQREHDVVYRHSPIKLWPPPSSKCACSKRLHRILNPTVPGPAHIRSITGVLDERRFIYIVRPGRSDNALGTIVMIDFSRNASVSKPNDRLPMNHGSGFGGQFDPRWVWTPGVCQKGICQ
jgi:hypothetical protein